MTLCSAPPAARSATSKRWISTGSQKTSRTRWLTGVARTGYGRGIAAPQIGEPVRAIYLTMGSPQILVNPVITAHSPATWEVWDACLSFSVEFFCKVQRFTSVDVAYESPDGSRRSLQASGELGELLQHEIDHLDGILAVDRMTSIETLCMRSEFERRYRGESPYRQ